MRKTWVGVSESLLRGTRHGGTGTGAGFGVEWDQFLWNNFISLEIIFVYLPIFTFILIFECAVKS